MSDLTHPISELFFPEASRRPDCVPRYMLEKVKANLLLGHFVDGHDNSRYLRILIAILGPISASQKYVINPIRSDLWLAVVSRAYDIVMLEADSYEQRLKNEYELSVREKAYAEVFKYLLARGYPVKISDGGLHLDSQSYGRLVNEIESIVSQVGGLQIISNLILSLSDIYDDEQGRFHLVRRFDALSSLELQVPCNVLYQLALKHACSSANSSVTWGPLICLLRCVSALYDVQPFSKFYSLGPGNEPIFEWIRRLTVYDSLYCPLQLRITDIQPIIEGTLGVVDASLFQTTHGFGLKDALLVVEKCLVQQPPSGAGNMMSIDELRPSGMDNDTLDAILNCFSHEEGKVNCDYGPDFNRVSNCDSWKKPLIHMKTGSYWLPQPVLSGWAFYEALVMPLYKRKPSKLENELGDGIEEFLKSRIVGRGVRVIAGKYPYLGKEMECDAVIESPNMITFIEMKKKALTWEARSGDVFKCLLDLTKGGILAQKQSLTHRKALKENGSIVLSDVSSSQTLEWKDRRIICLSLTFSDFGALHERLVFKSMVEFCATHQLVTAGSYAKEEQEINAMWASLQEFAYEESEAGMPPGPDPFFNCVFLSVPQLLVLLDDVDSAEAFESAISTVLHVSFSSGDVYFNYKKAKELKKGLLKDRKNLRP